MALHLRKTKLIQPRLQLWLAGSFVGLAGLALLLQFLFLAQRMVRAASALEGEGAQLAGEVPGMMLGALALSMLVLLPVILGVGVLLTFRIAGPLHRFDLYLAGIVAGSETEPCQLRDGDQLQDLCQRINAATEPVRRANAERNADAPGAPEAPDDAQRAAG